MFSAQELIECQCEYAPGKWGPAKPIAFPGMSLWQRFKDAWCVLLGNATAVKWY